ncbi:ubiquitin elongating factor core-domain-containing protein [Baffinella frigidus]|nr:ubiquitin elongating factor core-domain-containing protein [Cryptophyta sp. CCMP2293]
MGFARNRARSMQGEVIPGEMVPVRHPVGEACFAGMHGRNRQEVDIAVDSVRVQLHASQENITAFVRSMLKDPTQQDKMFNWIASTLKYSEARKMEGFVNYRHRMAPTSSEGFLFNLFTVMLRLCKPFFDPDDKKALKIDASWLAASRGETSFEVASWMDVRNQARIQQAQQTAAAARAAGGVVEVVDPNDKQTAAAARAAGVVVAVVDPNDKQTAAAARAVGGVAAVVDLNDKLPGGE